MQSKSRKSNRRLGQRLIAEFTQLRDTLHRGYAIEKRFTVRTVELDLAPKTFDAVGVRALRGSLHVSQAVFARIMGVSPDLVAAWEQGNRIPNRMACRLFELVAEDKDRWIKRLQKGTTTRAA